MVTPMRDDGSLHVQEAVRLAMWLVDNGSTGLVIAGTTGEGPTLCDEEKLTLFGCVVDAVGARAPVIANVGTNHTSRSIEFAKRAADCGVHALMAVGPYYNKPPQAGLIKHFTAIADATDLPLMIYNIPGRTCVNILPETIVRLADHPKILAIKESSGDIAQLAEIAARAPAHFDCYSGDDHLALPHAAVGGCGIVSVASHVAGPDIAEMFAAFGAGDNEHATAMHHRLMPLFRALFTVTSPIPVKAAVGMLGFAVGRCREPLCELSTDHAQVLREAIGPWLSTRAAVHAL
jgi:4-hydroxy-tetrahydrodipicolinate synthase